MSRRTKIVCTIGPAVATREQLSALVKSGMDIARLNFSHGDHANFAQIITWLREIEKEQERPVGILSDIQGPKIRVGKLPDGEIELKQGMEVWMTDCHSESGAPESVVIPTTYKDFVKDVGKNQRILLDDGLMSVRSVEQTPQGLRCEVVDGGVLKNNKGINVPDVPFSVHSITEKDYSDILFCLEQGVDFIALSFVRSDQEVRHLKEFIQSRGKRAQVIAKIEKQDALEALEQIIQASDGILIARGDLAVEVGNEMVPVLQKKIIRRCNLQGKSVIVATQMLMSMVDNPRPTRAEASDVANAILDGTDAMMLSNETAVGRYPIESLEMMGKIIVQTEREPRPQAILYNEWELPSEGQMEVAVLQGAVRLASIVEAKLIAVLTESGQSALLISKCRPNNPVVAVTSDPTVFRQLSLKWGVRAIFLEDMRDLIEQTALFEAIGQRLRALQLCDVGDKIVITVGLPHLARGSANTVKVQKI